MTTWRKIHARCNKLFTGTAVSPDRDRYGLLLLDMEIGLIEQEHRRDKRASDEIPAVIHIFLRRPATGICPERENRVLVRMARWCERNGYISEAADAYGQWIALSETHGNQEMVVQGLEELGDLHRKQGRFESAVEMQSKALGLAEKYGLHVLKAHAMNNLAVVAIETGEIDEAIRLFNRALDLLNTFPEKLLEGHIVNNIGVIHCIRGNPEKAIGELNRALICRAASGDRFGFAETSHNLGMAHLDLDQLDIAEDYLDRALHVARELGDGSTEANIQLSRSELFIKRNNPVIAGAVAAEARTLCESLDDPLGKAESLRFSGISEMEQFRYDSAALYLENALALNEAHGHILGTAQCAEVMCRLTQRTGSTEDVRKWASMAAENWRKLGNIAAADALAEFL